MTLELGTRVRECALALSDDRLLAKLATCDMVASLPPVIRLADSVDSFKAQLKTHLFAKAYPS